MYTGEVAYVDHYLGKLFQALESWNLVNNSVMLFLADHSHPLADQGKFLKGPDRMYCEILKVPAFLHFPGDVHGGMRHDALGLFHDLPVTLLDALGLGGDLEAFQGRSLISIIGVDVATIRESISTGLHEGIERRTCNQRWSHIRRPPGQEDEPYDLQMDAGETRNLIADHPEMAGDLSDQYGPIYETDRSIHGLMGEYETTGTATGTSQGQVDFHADGTATD